MGFYIVIHLLLSLFLHFVSLSLVTRPSLCCPHISLVSDPIFLLTAQGCEKILDWTLVFVLLRSLPARRLFTFLSRVPIAFPMAHCPCSHYSALFPSIFYPPTHHPTTHCRAFSSAPSGLGRRCASCRRGRRCADAR